MASNVDQQPWDDGVDICGQAVPMDNDEGWRRAVASMKQKDEPMESNEDDDGGLYERLMRDDARINAQLSDLRAAHRAGATCQICRVDRRPTPTFISASTGFPASPSIMSTRSARKCSSLVVVIRRWTAVARRGVSAARK